MRVTVSIGRLLVLLVMLVLMSPNLSDRAQAFSPAEGKAIATLLKLRSSAERLARPAADINKFAQIALKPGGTKKVGKTLGQLNLQNEVIEDTFARILIAQRRVQRFEAEDWMKHLSGVPGFRGALSKSMGASAANTVGHLNEVRIANSAARSNFKVQGIGVPFKDPNKNGVTDIDVLLERGGRQFAIEAKAYPANANIPLDAFRADMLTLAEYREANASKNVVSVFAITEKPQNPATWTQLAKAAKKHSVELLVGSPAEVVNQLPLL